MKKYIIGFILLAFASTAVAQSGITYKRYEIFVRIAYPLSDYINDNLATIQSGIDQIRIDSQKINGYEDTNCLIIGSTTDYLEIKGSLAIPYQLTQEFQDQQSMYEAILRGISPLCMATGTGYMKKIQSHICNNGLVPRISCSGITNY